MKNANSPNLATWLAVFVAVGALAVSSVSLWYSVTSERAANKENVLLVASVVRNDHQTELRELGFSLGDAGTFGPPSGSVDVYASILVSNNSQFDISLTEYDLWDIDERGSLSTYSGMDQGLYGTTMDGVLTPTDLPISIPAGHSERMYVKVGLLLHAEAFDALDEKFGRGRQPSRVAMEQHLAERGLDFLGNLAVQAIPGVTTILPSRDQVFLVSMTTGRGTVLQDIFSWFSPIFSSEGGF